MPCIASSGINPFGWSVTSRILSAMRLGAFVMITDSGMLMGEVLQSSRRPDGSAGGRVTSLLWALHRRGAVLLLSAYLSGHGSMINGNALS